MNWLKSGDKSTTFFHKCASQRRSFNSIKPLEFEDGRSIGNPLGMVQITRNYFENLFTSKVGLVDSSHILTGINSCIPKGINEALTTLFIGEEVYEVV